MQYELQKCLVFKYFNSSLPIHFLKQCSELSFFLAHLCHTDNKLHLLHVTISLKWKVPPLLQYLYNYHKNCYILLKKSNYLSQLFHAAAVALRSLTCFTAPPESHLKAEAKIKNS